MKKFILTIALSISMFSFAQDKQEEVKKDTISGGKRLFTISYTGGFSLIAMPPVKLNNSGIGTAGLSFELQTPKVRQDMSLFLNLNYAIASVSTDGAVHDSGSGYGIETGYLGYSGKNRNMNYGAYSGLSVSYLSCKFTDADYSGVYNYVGINAPFGWKGFIYGGEHIIVDLAIVGLYKIEIKPSGNVDNKSFENFELKGNVKIGWRF